MKGSLVPTQGREDPPQIEVLQVLHAITESIQGLKLVVTQVQNLQLLKLLKAFKAANGVLGLSTRKREGKWGHTGEGTAVISGL